MPLTSGTRIGSYEVVALLGSGGMGEVYRARDTKLKREVAIKILPDPFASDPDRLARFQREAELLATVNHPNIAQIHGVEDRALVLELVEGPTLAERIAHGPSVTGAAEQIVASTDQDESPADWSADGNTLLFTTQDQGASDIWAVPMKGDRKPFPVVRSGFDEIQPTFSPDGQWLAYASNESGRYEVYVHGFRGDLKWQVSTGGGSSPRWSRGGGELFYVALDSRLMAVPMARAHPTGFAPAPPMALFQTRLAVGGNIDSRGYLARAQYAVATDGRFLMNVTEGDLTPPISVVLNWAAELPK